MPRSRDRGANLGDVVVFAICLDLLQHMVVTQMVDVAMTVEEVDLFDPGESVHDSEDGGVLIGSGAGVEQVEAGATAKHRYGRQIWVIPQSVRVMPFDEEQVWTDLVDRSGGHRFALSFPEN